MTATPTTPKGRQTRDSILEAARQVFARDGFVGARMSAVAEDAGLSMGGLYRYFANKEDLFQELMGDIHNELFGASRSPAHRFADEPYEALLDANRGYLEHYYEIRDVMRAFIEAATVDERFRSIWWAMRSRHADHFAASLREHHDMKEVDGIPVEVASDALACMVEQSAYVWFAHDAYYERPVTVDDAARIVTRIWYRTFFGDEPDATPAKTGG